MAPRQTMEPLEPLDSKGSKDEIFAKFGEVTVTRAVSQRGRLSADRIGVLFFRATIVTRPSLVEERWALWRLQALGGGL